MTGERTRRLHRFEIDGRHFVIDPETCFCLECDEVSWAVFERYPDESFEEAMHRLGDRFPRRDIEEVISEIEWLRAGGSLWPKTTLEALARRYESPPPGLSEVTIVLHPRENAPGLGPCHDDAPPVAARGRFRSLFGRTASDPPRSSAPAETMDADPESLQDLVLLSGQLLLGRSGVARSLRLMLSLPAGADARERWRESKDVLNRLWKTAQLSEKTLTVGLVQHGDPASNPGNAAWQWSLETDAGPDTITMALDERPGRLSPERVAAWFESRESENDAIRGSVILKPVDPAFDGLVRHWRKTGFRRVILRDGSLTASLSPGTLQPYVQSARRNAEDYAADLLKGDLYLCEPFATWFRHIYNGEPVWRGDPAGTERLAVDAGGTIYPDEWFLGRDACRLGHIGFGRQRFQWDTQAACVFADLGVATTPACLTCWARGLCGGGVAFAHYQRTGSVNLPDNAWCDARRHVIEHVIAAFNTLSAAGIPFNDLHRALGRRKDHTPWRMMIRAARGALLVARPIREADAPMLTRWERWNPAACFTLMDSGVLLATCHDRENDALHPRPWLMELALIRPGNDRPIGLLRLMPHRLPATLWALLYLRNPADYAHSGTRRGLRDLLDATLRDRAVRGILVPVGPWDEGLAACLEAIGFTRLGALREALFLHGGYHDVAVFALNSGRMAPGQP